MKKGSGANSTAPGLAHLPELDEWMAKHPITQTAMTSAERTELKRLVRLNAKVAKDDAEARGAALLAEFEKRLMTVYKPESETSEDEEDNATDLTAGRKPVRPELAFAWLAAVRKVAQQVVAARIKEAKVEIDRHLAFQLTELTASALTSEEALKFLTGMPTPDDLLPTLGRLELPTGEVVALPESVTDDVTDTEPVTDPETATRNCAYCGHPFQSRRSDGRYCKPSHRVAAHRERIKRRVS